MKKHHHHSHSIQAPHRSAEPQLLYQQAEPTARSPSHSRTPQDTTRPRGQLPVPATPSPAPRSSAAPPRSALGQPGPQSHHRARGKGAGLKPAGRPPSFGAGEALLLTEGRAERAHGLSQSSVTPQPLTEPELLETTAQTANHHHVPHHPPL